MATNMCLKYGLSLKFLIAFMLLGNTSVQSCPMTWILCKLLQTPSYKLVKTNIEPAADTQNGVLEAHWGLIWLFKNIWALNKFVYVDTQTGKTFFNNNRIWEYLCACNFSCPGYRNLIVNVLREKRVFTENAFKNGCTNCVQSDLCFLSCGHVVCQKCYFDQLIDVVFDELEENIIKGLEPQVFISNSSRKAVSEVKKKLEEKLRDNCVDAACPLCHQTEPTKFFLNRCHEGTLIRGFCSAYGVCLGKTFARERIPRDI